MINVFLLDDHPLLLYTIEEAINRHKNYHVVGKSSGYTSTTLQEISNVKPDVIILDISMPNLDSFDLVPILKKQFPELKIVMYTMHSLNRYLQHFLKLGIDGYVIKSAELGNLEDAIESVIKNEKYFPYTILKQIANAEVSLEENQLQFTDFEKQLLKKLKSKKPNRIIVQELNCSLDKVLSTRKNLLVKTGTTNTNDLLNKIYEKY